MSTLDRYYHLIQKPVISEKASDDMGRRNAYHFRVPLDANKIEIRRAVEKLFDVKVVSVNTATVRGKAVGRRRGRSLIRGNKQSWKRAMVKLAEGNTIDIM